MCLPLGFCYAHTQRSKSTLSILYAFCFPILTQHVGIPDAYLITTNRKRVYSIVVPRRSDFRDSKGNFCSCEQRYKTKSGQPMHRDATFFSTSLLVAPRPRYLISLSYNSFSETKRMFSTETPRGRGSLCWPLARVFSIRVRYIISMNIKY